MRNVKIGEWKFTLIQGVSLMHSGNTKIYDRKTVGHVFTKPVQMEGTIQKLFFPSKFIFYRSSHFCRWVCVQGEIKWSPIIG
jgi:hypothetical protein